MSHQLPLQIGLKDGVGFSSYYAGTNQELVSHLQRLAQHRDELFVYLFGAKGTGKSHLLQSVCQQVAASGRPVAFLPLDQVADFDVSILEGLEQTALVCLDDVQCIATQDEWEEALFHLYNRLRQERIPLVVSANVKPDDLGLQLKDLQSRLNWGLLLQLKELDDPGKINVLQLKAQLRGLNLGDDVAHYLLRRCPRDMHTLYALLERLDHASMAAKRKLTVPFVKSLIDELLSQ